MKTLKHISIIILLAGTTLFTISCNKVKELTASDVNVNIPTQHFTFSGTVLKSGEVVLYSDYLAINLDSIMSANGVSNGSLTNATFTNLSVTIEQPADSTFHWMSSMRAVVADNENFNPENEIGTAVNNDPASKTLTVTLNNANISQYVNQQGFWLRLYCTPNGPIPAYTIGMFMNGSVKLKISAI